MNASEGQRQNLPMATSSGTDKDFGTKIQLLEAAVIDADSGGITNARKMEALIALDDLIPLLPKADVVKQQAKLEELSEKVLAQNATEPLRRLTVSVLNQLYRFGDTSGLPTFVSRLLKLISEQNKKMATDTRVGALDVVGEFMSHHGRALEHFGTDVFVLVAKHMKFPEANARISAFQCLCKTMAAAGIKSHSIASNIWKMLQKMLLDKAITVRTAAAHSLSALVIASPMCTAAGNGEAMAVCCLKALAVDDNAGAQASECRFAFSIALAQVLAAMAKPGPMMPGDRTKKKPAVTDFTSALDFLEQATTKGPPTGLAFANFRNALSLTAIRLADTMQISDCSSISLLMRMLLSLLDMPSQNKLRGGGNAGGTEDEHVTQVSRHLANGLRHLLVMADGQNCLLEVIEQGLLPLVSQQIHDAAKGADIRMVVVLETLCCACTAVGEGFRNIESKLSKPLLHVVGNHPNPIVQLHATYCLRVVARNSPAQLFQLMSALLKMATVQNAELLGAPLPRRRDNASGPGNPHAHAASHVSADLRQLVGGLFGHCAALAALNGELFHGGLGVPHDVTSAVLGTSRALLQPHPNATVSAQRRSCAFLLLEGLMCLGADWVGQRLTTLFALWKLALGKKPVDRAKVIYQQHVAATPSSDSSGIDAAAACRDELLSLLCALRSLYAFTLHSNETLLTSYAHLHRILVVFLTNVSQLVVALPHPASPSLRAKYRSDAPCQSKPVITLSAHCGIPEILLMIRSTMYRSFAAMLPSQYSSRFVPLLNMLADDVTRALPAEFPVETLIGHFLPQGDAPIDLVDPHLEACKDSSSTIRLAVATLLSVAPLDKIPNSIPAMTESPDLLADVAAASRFGGVPREGLGGTEGLLTPWDAWFDPAQPLTAQCTSPEWEWRCSAVSLLAIIMNTTEVSEAPRAAVLLHLLKRKDSGDEGGKEHTKRGQLPQGDATTVPILAVLAYLREHVRVRGIRVAPPASPMEQMLQFSLDSLKEVNPAVRRLHVEVLAMLFYTHHQLPESPTVPTIMQQITGDLPTDNVAVRSAVALLCGAVLRTFAWASRQLSGSVEPQALHCPYLINIVPALLKLAKETSQPVRLWMLHAIHVCIQAAGNAFTPFLKDTLRLATAHFLADFYESPLVLWVVAEIAHSAASIPTEASEESILQILRIWNELKHVCYSGPGSGLAFATVRTEVLSTSMASNIVRRAPLALNHLKDVFELISVKLAPQGSNGSRSCAVRTAAARCLVDFVAPGLCLGQDGTIMQEPSLLFACLDEAQAAEASALQDLVQALILQRGLPHLPMWLQCLKEIVLALPPGNKPTSGNDKPATRSPEDTQKDEHDDGASMAATAPDTETEEARRYRAPRSNTKVFAVRCAQLLLEQADPDDAGHFQVELQDGHAGAATKRELPQHRLVHQLETLVALAVHASSSDEESLAMAGLRLMLLIVRRFRFTRDIQGQTEGASSCPLLLVQFEAQMTTCIRHNSRAEANPATQLLALDLLRDVVVIRACNSTQRLVSLLMQPLSRQTFEPDPLFCEFASTQTFLLRLLVACEILNADLEEPALSGAHLRDLSRWIEHALRDSAVLLANLPLPSIKTYQPVCFSLADYKIVQPHFRRAFPVILKGVCALCDEHHPAASNTAPSSDLIALTLGVVFLMLSDHSTGAPEVEIQMYIRTVRQVLLHSTICGDGSSVVGLRYVLDLLACVWRHIFQVPTRRTAALADMVELMHAISVALFRRRRAVAGNTSGTVSSEDSSWLHTLANDSEDAEKARGIVNAYCFNVVSTSLQDSAIVENATKTSQVLDMFAWWLGDTLPQALAHNSTHDFPAAGCEEELVSAALRDETELLESGEDAVPPKQHCCWLWLLFLSPFPLELVRSQATITLKYWKVICAVLGTFHSGNDGSGSPNASTQQLLYMSLIANKLVKSLLSSISGHDGTLPETEERNVVYLFAMVVPVLSALCKGLHQIAEATKTEEQQHFFSNCGKSVVSKCMTQVHELFLVAFSHTNEKVVQTAVSSAQSLLQGVACATLFGSAVVPCLMLSLVTERPSPAVVEAAWGVLSSLAVGRQGNDDGSALMEATTPMVLKLVFCIADHTRRMPGSFQAHTAAMAQCLVQAARSNPQGLKAQVAAMPSGSQQMIQQLLVEHMSMPNHGTGVADGRVTSTSSVAANKIELKLKF